jgi:hypothetical protein
MVTRVLLLAGAMAAVAFADNWKDIAKGGMKLGLRASRRINELSARVIEDLEDLAASASAEVAAEDELGKTARESK